MQADHDASRRGVLIAIGGNEDKTQGRTVLKEVLKALPPNLGGAPRVVVLTAANRDPERQWLAYQAAFEALDAEVFWLDVRCRADAEAAASVDLIQRAHLVFMTGGDQDRLADLVDGTAAHRLLAQRYREQEMAIAGTSAGASALGAAMPSGGEGDDADAAPALAEAPVSRGLALIRGVVIDQHFSQRQRLARLISLASRQGGWVGLGIDEDTAAVIRPGPSLTVVGSGSVTLVDCRTAHMSDPEEAVASLRHLSLHRASVGVTLRPGAVPRLRQSGIDLAALLP